MRGLYFLMLVALFLVGGCETASKKNKLEQNKIKNLRKLVLAGELKANIINKFGEPAERTANKWVYYDKGTPKSWLFFEKERLTFITFSVWQADSINAPQKLLKSIHGQWEVVKEPMTNPHSAPSLCYLEDLKNGQRVEVNSFKKSVSKVSFWRPSKTDKSIREHLKKDVGKEFCIAGHCSRVTDPGAWEYDHCVWLEKLVAETKSGVRKEKAESKKR